MRRRSHMKGEANIALKEDVYTEKMEAAAGLSGCPAGGRGAVGVAEPEGHESLRRPA